METNVATSQVAVTPSHVALDRHFSIAEIAQQWGVSRDTVRRHFERVPGILRLGHAETKTKRRYITVRVPERIVRAQHTLLTMAVSS